MSKAAMNLQDSFLNQVRRENAEVKVLLVNGTVLRGIVKGFDNFTLILNNKNGQHLVYKHAIAQLVSHRQQTVRQGDEHGGTGDLSDNHADFQQDLEPVATVVPAMASAPAASGDSRPKARKEGFNTIDLSGVKIGEGKK